MLSDVSELGGSGGPIAPHREERLAMAFDTGAMHRGYLTTCGRLETAVT